MKRILFVFIALIAISLTSFAQAPEGFKYQAVVRDVSNNIIPNQAVGFQITIKQGSASGTTVYTETFAVTTNDYGLVNLEIGTGITVDDFTIIDWGNDLFFIETAIDVTGGTTYAVMGTSQLISVPYALHAKTAENVFSGDYNDLANQPTVPTLTSDLTNDSGFITSPDDADADSTNELNTTVVLNGTNLETTDAGGTIITDLSSLQDGVNDADADPTNEYNTSVVLNGTDLEVTDGNGTITTSLSSLAGTGNWTLSGNNIYNSNTGNVGIGLINPFHTLAIMNTTSATFAIGNNDYNYAESGKLTFSEDVDAAGGDCGFQFAHDGASNSLSLFSGCPIPTAGDTLVRYVRAGQTHIKKLRVGSATILPTNPLSVTGNSDFTGDMTITGNLTVSGTIAKGGGTFKIDHPLDPANKYLVHSFVESPEMMNVYSGNVVTDANGFATVELPSYFKAVNKDFRYQLTVIGTFAQAIVKDKIQNNTFVIQTNTPNVEVSWQVTAVRADKFANANRVVAEQEKEMKGTYIHPELYGAGKETQEAAYKAKIATENQIQNSDCQDK